MKYSWSGFCPTWEGMPFLVHAVLMHMYGFFTCEVHVLPPFKPNEYLFEKHAQDGKENWEVYAEAVRDVMAIFGGFKKNE
jgi:hypothetical protein